MEKKEYISDDLYKMSRNNANFNLQDKTVKDVSNASADGNSLSKAQMRRLSDVYNAKLDLMARMERSVKKLSMLDENFKKNAVDIKNTLDLLRGNLDKLSGLSEPDGGRELHDYLREVEHLRMEYFRMEAEIEPLLNIGNSVSGRESFWEELSGMSKRHLMKIGFVFMLPFLLTLMASALIIAAAIIIAWKI